MSFRKTVFRWYLRTAFWLLVFVPAVALVTARDSVSFTDPEAPHFPNENMLRACIYAYTIVCFRASFVENLDRHAWILAEFGAPCLILWGTLIELYDCCVNASKHAGMTFIGAYFITIGGLLALLRWPDLEDSLWSGPKSVGRFFAQLPGRIRSPKSPRPVAYFALFIAVLFTVVVALLQPGIGLAFRWYPYKDPAALGPTESIIMAFFVPFAIIMYRVFDDLYAPYNILFTEFASLMGFFHGFVMMTDSIMGTQGNTNIHHVVGGDVLLMFIIGTVLAAYHPGIGSISAPDHGMIRIGG
ncbi:hypothetical protein HK105_207965 [Polyrhizophydium stewartii]|uniref:Uncharacterized protein n=1 Tax=Polyrhizophydium stewartii TaxID=2732419 RepID=A0ABR4MZ69_9FUNG|nr:hypothetical protein HK105_002568 [Polyrhizophydium stewartii]